MSPARTRRVRVPLRPPQAAGQTSAVLWEPEHDTGRVGLVLGHSAGTDMTDAVLLAVGRGLADRGYPVLTFNFAFAEVGRRPPDPPARLDAAFIDAIGVARHEMGGRDLVLGGRSLGGRVASRLAAGDQPCAGLVLLGYPLHPARRPERLRTDHWVNLDVPMLFVQGDRDLLCDLTLLESERNRWLPGVPSDVHVVAGADHSFGVRKTDGRAPSAVLEEVTAAVADWLDGRFASGREVR